MPASKSAVCYMPLINMKVADSDTVYTAITEGLRIVQEANQDFLVLSAVPVPAGVFLAPDYVLWLIRCGCESHTTCKSGNCRYTGQQILCTIFCACTGGPFCFKKFTSKPPDNDDNDGDVVQGMN